MIAVARAPRKVKAKASPAPLVPGEAVRLDWPGRFYHRKFVGVVNLVDGREAGVTFAGIYAVYPVRRLVRVRVPARKGGGS